MYKDISDYPPYGKTVRVFEVHPSVIDTLYDQDSYPVDDSLGVYPNQALILKSEFGSQSCLCYVDKSGRYLVPANEDISYFKIRGRNKEQKLLQNLFADPEIRVIVITGAAGTGKTTMIGGYCLSQLMEERNYSKLLLSKPLEIVTTTRYWGTVPGDADDKFGPFLKSYQMMFENLVGGAGGRSYVQTAIQKGSIEFFPLELMRGASLRDSIVWYDEAQNLNYHEMETLGSRIDDVGRTKLILSGDLGQRDKKIARGATGLNRLVTSPHFLNSPFTAHIDLRKNERGAVSQLFFDVFDDGDE